MPVIDTSDVAALRNKTETRPCTYILDGAGRHHCGAPALPGASYCAAHRRRCQVPPRSAAGGRAIRALERASREAAPPPELGFLGAIAVPEELDTACEPRDLAGCIDLAPPFAGGAE